MSFKPTPYPTGAYDNLVGITLTLLGNFPVIIGDSNFALICGKLDATLRRLSNFPSLICRFRAESVPYYDREGIWLRLQKIPQYMPRLVQAEAVEVERPW